MLKKTIKRKLLEKKEIKEKKLISERIIKSRFSIIIESKEKYNSLSESEKRKVFFQVINEIQNLEEKGLVTEGLGDILSGLFGQTFSGIAQGFLEPMISSILSWFGLTGYFNKFVTSFIASDPSRLAKAFTNCRELTKLISEALTEGLAMMLQQNMGMESRGAGILRNMLGGAVKETTFVKELENKLAEGVCQLFGKFTDKAQNLADKVMDKGPSPVGA